MKQEERHRLILEMAELEKDMETPSQMRRYNEIKSLLLSDGKTSTIEVKTTGAKDSYFSKRSMAGFTNRRRRK